MLNYSVKNVVEMLDVNAERARKNAMFVRLLVFMSVAFESFFFSLSFLSFNVCLIFFSLYICVL